MPELVLTQPSSGCPKALGPPARAARAAGKEGPGERRERALSFPPRPRHHPHTLTQQQLSRAPLKARQRIARVEAMAVAKVNKIDYKHARGSPLLVAAS